MIAADQVFQKESWSKLRMISSRGDLAPVDKDFHMSKESTFDGIDSFNPAMLNMVAYQSVM